MKKNLKLLGITFTILGFVLIFIGSYAYYMRVVNGTITGNAGAFIFDVLYNDVSFTTVDLYDTIELPSSSNRVIVPGDKGSFDLVAKGTGSDTSIEYSISFNTSTVPENMIFYLDEGKTQVLDIYTNKINGYLDVTGTMEKTHTIYWEWPYDSGRYNDLDINHSGQNITINVTIAAKQAEKIYVYGVSRDTNSTSTEWTRVADSVGLVANAYLPTDGATTTATGDDVVNDFDNIYPWSDIKSYNYVAIDKKITAWYGDSNFKFDGSNGEVLTFIPGFYYKREVVDGIEYQYISKYELEGYSYSEPFSVGRYKMCESNAGTSVSNSNDAKTELMGVPDTDVFRGRSASGISPKVYGRIGEFRESASTLGSEFSIMDYHYFVLQMLYLVEYADYDAQAKLGMGVVNTGSTVTMGGTDELGMNSGCLVNDGAHSMIYRGIEDIFGNVAEFIDGINIKDYQAYINYDFRTYWSDTFDGDYKPLGYVNANGYGWITKIGYDSSNPLIGLPTTVTSEETDYNASIKDGYYSNSGERILVAGGAYNNSDNNSGLWLSVADSGSRNYRGNVGSRLVRHQTSGGRGVTNPQGSPSSGTVS